MAYTQLSMRELREHIIVQGSLLFGTAIGHPDQQWTRHHMDVVFVQSQLPQATADQITMRYTAVLLYWGHYSDFMLLATGLKWPDTYGAMLSLHDHLASNLYHRVQEKARVGGAPVTGTGALTECFFYFIPQNPVNNAEAAEE